ncbi:MAG: hypothetical protein J6S54_07200 [Lentisphaeria bacterium]|nr:hypothetical protein [Lentisphaeria bacterium]
MLYASFDSDREYLVNKFRKPVFEEGTGVSQEEIIEHILEFADTLTPQNLPKPVIKARCFEHVCQQMFIDVNPHDDFPGFGCYDRKKRPLSPLVGRWNYEVDSTVNKERAEMCWPRNSAGLHMIWKDFDHSVPDWDAMVELGYPGLLERLEKYRKLHEEKGTLTPAVAAHFEGMKITVNALLDHLGKLIDFARARHAGNPRIEREIRCLEQLRQGPPRDFYEVLMLIYVQFYYCEHIDHFQVRSLGGNLDDLLLPFYERDLKEGRYTIEDMREFLTCFLMQWGSIDNYWGHPFYLGGTAKDGSSLYNDVSYLILDVFDELHIPTPKIQLKVAKNTPQKLLDTAFRMIRDGHSSLVFVSDDNIRKIKMCYGYSEEEARTCNVTGCYETAARGIANGTGAGHANFMKIFELIFNDGRDPATGYTVENCGALKLDEIKNFDDFFKSFLRYLDDIIEVIIKCADGNEANLHEVNPSLLYSVTALNSLVTGRDAFSNGNVYNVSGILLCGIGTAVDALMAVKKFVFEKKELTLQEFREILKNNWAGAEELRTRILLDRDKFGNGIEEVDFYAHILAHYAGRKINMRPNARKGFYAASGHSARQFISMGGKTGATPDGRLAGEEFSKNLSPTMGMDRNGVTALIKSVCTMNALDLPGDFPLDVMMHPATVQGEEGLAALRGLLYTYFAKGGVAIHFNIFDAETLKKAQVEPEKYANLQIRVCGWNVRFVELPKCEQDAYIRRAENIAE